MENIKSSELRIGNLLQDKVSKTVLRVIELNEKDIVTYVIDRDVFPLKIGWGLEPIPITEEILLKCLFDKKEGRFGNEYHLGGFVLYTSEKGNICFVWDEYITDFYFLHEIQNLYKDLMKKELEINL